MISCEYINEWYEWLDSHTIIDWILSWSSLDITQLLAEILGLLYCINFSLQVLRRRTISFNLQNNSKGTQTILSIVPTKQTTERRS
ncbi:Oidioi.mRNA.OKI2018_I69.chr2.g5860.t2.cds [Oikopleura dioica]|uniref:Oidioi.mRNA.OKI2018_I69.chr2.g5860.t2.cds n=1 Tax=Oikopleura dioica TaxID=34765 RepID=A0ABN7T7L5_OIKDI|nr:Oidioi.mRNA.OKI2018_I69.chr2.g5860.t2.cds [Oikopleura dioica]